MAQNLIDLRRRIRSVKDTQKTTKAMKTVSAAKLRRSVSELNRTRPVMEKIASLLVHVSEAGAKSGRSAFMKDHPFLEKRKNGNTVVVVIASDKGLCGAFNSHIIAKAEAHYNQRVNKEGGAQHVSLITVGNKVHNYFKNRKFRIKKNYPKVMSRLDYQTALDLSNYLQEIYLDEEENIKSIEFVFTGFMSAARQERMAKQFLPISSDWEKPGNQEDVQKDDVDYIFEPSAEEIFKALLPRYINTMVFQVMLQSSASEHASRMIAMDQATNNASDMIRSLTLTMNKMRQASITKELLEIITATEALRK